ncbi:hypothetical protein MYXO_02242 [Myxococcaceae bacterium]|nr:hypothetical protein MYXO_02242 [Myxococcaceae bacterium]
MSGGEAALSSRRFRVGLVVGSLRQPRWVHRLVAALDALPGVEIVPIVESVRRKRGVPLVRVYAALDRLVYAKPEDALSESALAFRLGEPSAIGLDATGNEAGSASMDRLRALDLDVAVRLGVDEEPLRGADLARRGVLSLRHGTGDDGLREVLLAEPVTATELVRLGSVASQDAVLDRSWSQTDSTSLHASRERLAAKGGSMLLRAIRRLREDRPARAPYPASPVEGRVAAVATARGLVRLATRRAREVGLRLCFEDGWIIAAQRPPTWPPDPTRFEPWEPPPGMLWADPFPFVYGGRLHVFVEEAALDAPRAHLSVIEVGGDGRPGAARRILERPYHLSYPFVFEAGGQIYLVPETAENRTIEIYRCRVFPDQWELAGVLVSGIRAADATLLEHAGRWWIFACVAIEDALPLDELHLFHAPGPLGPFEPFAANPVVSDVRSARPAGRIFRHGDAWIRPAQDGSGRYGRAVRFERIVRLEPSGYEEREVASLEPGWSPGVRAVHTWNACEQLAMVDLVRRRRRF